MHEAMIGGSPTLNNWLAIVGVVSLIYWAWRVFDVFQHRTGSAKPTPKATAGVLPIAPGLGAAGLVSPLEDIAVIAAAVAAMMGAHRIVHLQAVGASQNWAAEGRWMNQTSHNPG
jgi:hypothetical protein